MRRVIMSVASVCAIVMAGSACVSEFEAPNPEPEQEAIVEGQAAQPLTASCTAECGAEYTACRNGCRGLPAAERFDCFDGCGQEQAMCLDGTWSFKARTNTICHLDVDEHVLDVDVEFYTVDVYQDLRCGNPDRYGKRLLGTVSCSTWTGLTNPSVCSRRVENKTLELVGQGYFPTFTQPNTDQCPTPRL